MITVPSSRRANENWLEGSSASEATLARYEARPEPPHAADTIRRQMDQTADATSASLPIGRTGLLEAMPLSLDEDAAVLVRERGDGGRPRALLTSDKLPAGERLVVMPLDEEVEVRVDGDALAVWLGSGSLMAGRRTAATPPTDVPIWASLVGGVLLLLVIAFAVIGSAVAFTWVARLLS